MLPTFSPESQETSATLQKNQRLISSFHQYELPEGYSLSLKCAKCHTFFFTFPVAKTPRGSKESFGF